MITEQHQKESLSRAFAMAVGCKAGMNCQLGAEFDYKIDGNYREVEKLPNGKRAESGFQIDFQLKASENVIVKDDIVEYNLDADNYRHLINQKAGTPRILILFRMPKNIEEWLEITEENTVLRNSAWYCSLNGNQYKDNSSTVKITIPRANLLTPSALSELMEKVKAGEKL